MPSTYRRVKWYTKFGYKGTTNIGALSDMVVLDDTMSKPSMTYVIIMGMKVGPMVMVALQSNCCIGGHHIP